MFRHTIRQILRNSHYNIQVINSASNNEEYSKLLKCSHLLLVATSLIYPVPVHLILAIQLLAF
jgi:hypothetical protein